MQSATKFWSENASQRKVFWAGNVRQKRKVLVGSVEVGKHTSIHAKSEIVN